MHPNFLWILDQFLIKSAKKIVVTSNGTFLEDKELVNALEDRALIWSDRFLVQITNDPRYYPRKIPEVPGCFYFTEKIPSMNPCKRQRENGYIVNRRGPGCFNLRFL